MRLAVGPSSLNPSAPAAADEVELGQGELLRELALDPRIRPGGAPGPDQRHQRQPHAAVRTGEGGRRAVGPERDVGVVDHLRRRREHDVALELCHPGELPGGVLQAHRMSGLIEHPGGAVAVAPAQGDEAEEERGGLGQGRVGARGLEQRNGAGVLSELVAGDALEQVDRPVVAASARRGEEGERLLRTAGLERVDAGLQGIGRRGADGLEPRQRLDRPRGAGERRPVRLARCAEVPPVPLGITDLDVDCRLPRIASQRRDRGGARVRHREQEQQHGAHRRPRDVGGARRLARAVASASRCRSGARAESAAASSARANASAGRLPDSSVARARSPSMAEPS